MARTDFDRELTTLMDELLSLGSMVQKSLLLSLDALKTRDLKLSKEVIANVLLAFHAESLTIIEQLE